MINESQDFAQQVMWFTSLVSKNDNVRPLKRLLNQIGAKQVKVVSMSQGQKVSRLIAWSFFDG
jgi:23S rRNA (adenine1618-N6)-methyltransferase